LRSTKKLKAQLDFQRMPRSGVVLPIFALVVPVDAHMSLVVPWAVALQGWSVAWPSSASIVHGHFARMSRGDARMVLSEGDEVLVCGAGPVMLLAAKLAAIKGYKTTCALPPRELEPASSLVYTPLHPMGSLPLKFIPIGGPDADSATFDACVAKARGVIIALDGEATLPESAVNIFLPAEQNLERVAVMSRYLNGAGMGFFATAAKFAANADVWAANDAAVGEYKKMEGAIAARSAELGIEYSIIRAGTLKGGGIGDSLLGEDKGGEASFLNPAFYNLGQQDVVNWRLLYDCSMLGVALERGDSMPGPGVMAATTATTNDSGQGDSHRGAVASALVEALSSPAAANRDFSVGARKARSFPDAKEWQDLFAQA